MREGELEVGQGSPSGRNALEDVKVAVGQANPVELRVHAAQDILPHVRPTPKPADALQLKIHQLHVGKAGHELWGKLGAVDDQAAPPGRHGTEPLVHPRALFTMKGGEDLPTLSRAIDSGGTGRTSGPRRASGGPKEINNLLGEVHSIDRAGGRSRCHGGEGQAGAGLRHPGHSGGAINHMRRRCRCR